jgi:hypothetical protein
MSIRSLSQRTKRLVLLSVALSLLFAQGVRLCVHSEGHVSSAGVVASAPAVHLESIPAPDDGDGDEHHHSSLGLAFVKLISDIPFVFLVTALLFIGTIWRPFQVRLELETSPVTRAPWSLRPPLRAPPL